MRFAGWPRPGFTRVVVVVGYGAGEIEAHIAERCVAACGRDRAHAEFERPNGTSVLAAEPLVGTEEVLARDVRSPRRTGALSPGRGSGRNGRSAARRRSSAFDNDWVDLEDVTRVRTRRRSDSEIGKGIADYDCFDTGVFAIGPKLFDALRSLESPSLTEAMRTLASRHQPLRWTAVSLAGSMSTTNRH